MLVLMERYNFKIANYYLLYVCLIVSKFIGSGSTVFGSAGKGESANVKGICKLSKLRFPDRNHKVSDILHTYELCLKKIDHYSEKDREKLTKVLANRLECFKEDLKQAYYAGNIEYNDIQLVENFLEELHLKNGNLKFNGLSPRSIKCGVARKTRSTVKLIPLVLTGTLSEKKKACEAVFKQLKGINSTQVEIPTPKLDDNKDPKELTVPLTNPQTFNVDSPEADNALTQYYKVVMKCLTLTTKHQIQVFRFNKKFYDWLTTAVLPHLKDEKCYPAFGGVLRIVQTMQENDYVPKNSTANFIFYRQKNLESQGEAIRRKENACEGKRSPLYVNYLIIWPLVIFLVILLCYQYYLYRSSEDSTCSAGSTYSEVFYYPIEGTPSISIDFERGGSRPASNNTSYESINRHGNGPQSNLQRERGGRDKQVYSLIREEENILLGVPLKRQCSSKESSSCMKSPGKRQRKLSRD